MRAVDAIRQDPYEVRALRWLEVREDGLTPVWVLFWLSVPCAVVARLLQDRVSWIWYLAAVPFGGAAIVYGTLRRRLNKLAASLGLICWHCGNIAVESPQYFRVENPGATIRKGRCLWCFRVVDQPEG